MAFQDDYIEAFSSFDPELYEKGNILQYTSNSNDVKKILPLMLQQNDQITNEVKNEIAVDIGCGPGNFTWNVLRSLLPSSIKLIGADISAEMLAFATEKYSDLDFIQMDIGAPDIPKHLQNAFNYIFSFFCLHFIEDKRNCMKNMYNLLKPGGFIFVKYLAFRPEFKTIIELAKSDKWRKLLPAFQLETMDFSDDITKNDTKSMLINLGFEIFIFECKTNYYEFSNFNDFKNFLIGINPYYNKISDNLKEAFINDVLQKFLSEDSFEKKNGKFIVMFKYNIIFAAKK